MKKKMKVREVEEAGNGGAESFSSQNLLSKVIDVHLLQTEAYICLEKGKLQNNMK